MSDSLRDRIAAAIAKADQDWCSDNPLHDDMADAVIAELGLRLEYGRKDEWEDTVRPVIAYEGQNSTSKLIRTRYITDWKADDE